MPDADRSLRRLLAAIPPAAEGAALGTAAAVADRVADQLGVPAKVRAEIPLLADVEHQPVDESQPAPLSPDVLGPVYEQAVAGAERRRRGVHFTPGGVADGLVRVGLDGLGSAPRVVDPAVGGGAFLLASARALVDRGIDAAECLDHLLTGFDIDPDALLVADAALALWGWSELGELRRPRLRLADGLRLERSDIEGPVDLVIGNPPFLSQLGTETARSQADIAALRDRFGSAAGGLVDSAALFLLVGLELVGDAGRVVLIQPRSMLAASDAAQLRAQIATDAHLVGLWVDGGTAFDAAVDVCAPVLEVGSVASPDVVQYIGSDVTPAGTTTASGARWAALAPDIAVLPEVAIADHGARLDSLAAVTAGFRDEYYALAEVVTEAAELGGEGCPLVTVGMIDPLHNRWGSGGFRFAKRAWDEPVVDLAAVAAVAPRVNRWIEGRLVPKVLVATQTRVLEPIVDRDGRLVPVTPALSVEAEPEALDHIAAVLLAPPVVARLRRDLSGTGLSARAIRVTASQLRELPLPPGRAAWDAAATAVREAGAAATAGDARAWSDRLRQVGALMCDAYDLGPTDKERVLGWWASELPPWRS